MTTLLILLVLALIWIGLGSPRRSSQGTTILWAGPREDSATRQGRQTRPELDYPAP